MKLTETDQLFLKSIGVKEVDFPQIGDAADETIYELTDIDGKDSLGRISRKTAIERLGREGWLSGLARSAFHCTAMRQTVDCKNYVFLDSSRIFE